MIVKYFSDFLNENNKNITPRDGIKELFDKNNELGKIGTMEQYDEYLNTIFPDSKVKDIVYHRTPVEFDKFDKTKIKASNGKRFYFSPFNTGRYGKNLVVAILDIKNLADPYDEEFIKNVNKEHPEYTEGKSQYFYLPAQIYNKADKYGYDGVFAFKDSNDDEYSVYEPEQIHILGNKNDLEGFKKFCDK